MKMKIVRLLLFALIAFPFVSCEDKMSSEDVNLDEIFSSDSSEDGEQNTEPMKVVGLKFSPDYKTLRLFTSVVRGMGSYSFTDTSQVYVKGYEVISGIENTSKGRPRLVKVINSEGDEVKRRNIKVNVLVDLNLPQNVVDKECNTVKEMMTVFTTPNLYVTFMHGNEVSETMAPTDYVLNNYFVSYPDSAKYLYRSILLKKKEMEDRVGVWSGDQKMSLVVFSDERVYSDEDEPYDPDHFELEEQLVGELPTDGDSLTIQCVHFSESGIPESDQGANVLQVLCKNYHGLYQQRYDWVKLKNSILRLANEQFIANEFVFENPDGKVYRGNPHQMKIEVYDKKNDSLIGWTSCALFLGNAYNPVIVNGYPVLWVFVQGLGLAIFIFVNVYLIFQFLIPYIRYRLFKRKYIVKYIRGINMSVGNVYIDKTCYFCKAPFEDGDEVVAKCDHVMHKSCWDENGYHCPEYGRNCQHGSHYYNHKNLFDSKNASFYMKWTLTAIVAAFFAWMFYMLYATNYSLSNEELVAQMRQARLDVIGTSAVFGVEEDQMRHMPTFGLIMGFFLTLAMSVLAVRRQQINRRVVNIFMRALIVGVTSFFVFLIAGTITFSFELGLLSVLIDWIPWSVMAVLIAYISTIGTRIVLRRSLVLVAGVLGVLSMYLWSLFFRGIYQIDIRALLLISCILFAVVLAVAVAAMAPKSERYFLNVKGAVKEMDVAIYKWFYNNPDEVVTLGKSIDCSLHMSWDLKGKVAPVQAEIKMVDDALRLTALEEGVMFNNKPLNVGKSIWLYHNTSFLIGDTTFTYIERDL